MQRIGVRMFNLKSLREASDQPIQELLVYFQDARVQKYYEGIHTCGFKSLF